MNLQNKIIFGFSCLLAFIFGVFIDRCIKNFPYLQLDSKVGVIDVANLFVTIAIAIMIPFLVSKLIEDRRGIKTMLVDELKEMVLIISKIRSVITDAHTKGEFKAVDRDNINYIFHEAELKANSIREQMGEGIGEKSKITTDNLIELLSNYKDYLTGGELMLSSFTSVDERFYRESNTEYSKIETGLKTLIQKVHKF